MSGRLNGTGLFTQLVSGLNNSYAFALRNADSDAEGITLDNILSSFKSTTGISPLMNGINSSFTSYLSTNFNGMDKNGDGVISSEELSNFTNQLYTQGLTQEQLALLCSYGNASSTLQEVLDNFNEIDKNHDGRVTQAEISTYGIDEEVRDKKSEYMKNSAAKMSIFYSSSSSSDADKTTEV